MTSTRAPQARRGITWVAGALAMLLMLMTAGVTNASAAGDRTVDSGTLSWGVKASFRSYLTGFIANGKITTSGGATQDADGVVTYSGGHGAVTADGSAHIAYKGAARYYGHDGELDFTLADPYVMVDKSGTGALYVQYSVAQGAPKSVKIVTLSGAAPVVDGDKMTLTNSGAALTDEGVEVFSYKGHGFYPSGTVMDPVNANGHLAAAPTTSPTSSPTTTTSPTSQPTSPTTSPTNSPTSEPTSPTSSPTGTTAPPTSTPTSSPTSTTSPTSEPTSPTGSPTSEPTQPSPTSTGGDGPIVETDIV